MSSREQAKLEQRLKALLREAPNKRCINCEAMVSGGACEGSGEASTKRINLRSASSRLFPPPQGPQYVVSNFNVFVCTVCSGVQ